MKRIVIFASGNGTNAENIIRYFQKSSLAKVVLVLSNKSDAKVLTRAKNLGVPARHFSKETLHSGEVLKTLTEFNPDLIVLAGFLLKLPENIISEFPGKIINIHPALLPKHGGKGMYGNFVHQAVIQAKDKESGISIHYVNDEYDSGAIIFQKSVSITPEDTPESLAKKIHELEYKWFPKVIEELIKKPDKS
ncbi:MAG: phosphoribosylglycinamide formyltransferase [Bacteroidetes bacterium]|jgi:phosphoribosylglycinamide formyltransferase-1|nr:phosphoribosylglycinamide formyltransferase [Bacteroidota bacterium]